MRTGIESGNKSVEALAATFVTTSDLLRKLTEGETVNEGYIYDILDKWAADRGVKRKK